MQQSAIVRRARLLVALFATSLITLSLAVVPSSPANAAPANRIAGASRIETAVAISLRAFPATAPVAYLAQSTVLADALADTPRERAADGLSHARRPRR